jgi:hypothetical protein
VVAHAEDRQSLWMLVASPAVWAVHFTLSYVTAAIWCAKAAGPTAALGGARLAILAYTAVALAAIVAMGALGWRRHRYRPVSDPDRALPHDADTPEDRHRFLGFATFLLSSLSGVATIWVALAAVLAGTCR